MPNLDSEGAGALPVAYAWLRDELGPKMITEALKLFGTLEAPGARDNPTILAWAKEVGQGDVYVHDSIAWCGLFMAVVAKRAGKPIPDKPLWALSWGEWGGRRRRRCWAMCSRSGATAAVTWRSMSARMPRRITAWAAISPTRCVSHASPSRVSIALAVPPTTCSRRTSVA